MAPLSRANRFLLFRSCFAVTSKTVTQQPQHHPSFPKLLSRGHRRTDSRPKSRRGGCKAGLAPRTWRRAEKPRPGSSLRVSLSRAARLRRAASVSGPGRTSFRAPHGCLAEARRSARSALSTGRRASGMGDNGVARKRNAEARTGVWAPLAMATRSIDDPLESPAAVANRSAHRTLGFPVPRA